MYYISRELFSLTTYFLTTFISDLAKCRWYGQSNKRPARQQDATLVTLVHENPFRYHWPWQCCCSNQTIELRYIRSTRNKRTGPLPLHPFVLAVPATSHAGTSAKMDWCTYINGAGPFAEKKHSSGDICWKHLHLYC